MMLVRRDLVYKEEDGLTRDKNIRCSKCYTKDWLENRLTGSAKRTLGGIVGRMVQVRFEVR